MLLEGQFESRCSSQAIRETTDGSSRAAGLDARLGEQDLLQLRGAGAVSSA